MRRSIRTVVAALATVAVVATACGSTSTPAAEPQAPAPTAADAPATAAPAQSGSDLSGEINVAGSTTGVVEKLAPLRRAGIVHNVVILQIVGGTTDRQVVRQGWLPTEGARHSAHEVLSVPIADLLPQFRRSACPVELASM